MADKLIKTFSEINAKRYSSLINTVGFLSYSLDEYNFSKDPNLKKNEKEALTYSSILLLIAGIHYGIIYSNEPNTKSEILIRYSDWFFTTPLLLKVMTSYYDLSNKISYELIVYNLIMIIFGLIYELTDNINYWVIGVIAYLVLIYRLFSVLPKLDFFFRYFVVGWGLYGVVSLMERKDRLLSYNILDLYNKLVFAIEIRTRISTDINNRNINEKI
jgi:bacteriorhodopsin